MGLTKPFAFMGAGGAAGALVDTDLNFYVDAGLTDSYPGSGTLWTDLEETTDQTLESGITHTSGDDGYLLSDATRITLMDMAQLDGSDNMRLVARYSAGVQTGVGADIVRQS